MEKHAVTDPEYKKMLLDVLEVGDPADAANQQSIANLEEMILTLGLELPLVRRITEPVEDVDLTDPNAVATWGQTDKGIEFFDEPGGSTLNREEQD